MSSAVSAMSTSYNTARASDAEFQIQLANQRQTVLAAEAAKLAREKDAMAKVQAMEKELVARKLQAELQKKIAEAEEAKKKKLNYTC